MSYIIMSIYCTKLSTNQKPSDACRRCEMAGGKEERKRNNRHSLSEMLVLSVPAVKHLAIHCVYIDPLGLVLTGCRK